MGDPTFEREAYQALLEDTITQIEQEVAHKNSRAYGVTPHQSRSIIGSARQHARHVLSLAMKAQVAADRLEAMDRMGAEDY